MLTLCLQTLALHTTAVCGFNRRDFSSIFKTDIAPETNKTFAINRLANELATLSWIMKGRAGWVHNHQRHAMQPPFRSLVFRGIWKFLRGSSSLDLWAGEGELLQLRTSPCTLLRRSGASRSGITPSLHPGWSPFWLAVAEVVAEFFWGSPPSGCKAALSLRSESVFPTAPGLRAIFWAPRR